jgi:hypothetical protein
LPPLRRPPSPRRPPPPPLRRLTLGRLRLSAPRDDGSLALESKARFERWDRFQQLARFRQGEHITAIGATSSGKTVLERELVKKTPYTVVLGTKNSDTELYGGFEKLGFEMTSSFDAEPEPEESRVIFRPRLTSSGRKGVETQREAFELVFDEVLQAGGWHIVCDELWTLTNRLNLTVNLETFWTAGRSEGITVVGATQEPVYIPLLAYTAATHLFYFRTTDRRRIDRMAELSAGHYDLVREILPILPEHEFLYINTRTGQILRSKVALPA